MLRLEFWLIMLLQAAVLAGASAQPKIEVESGSKFDLGTMSAGTVMKRIVNIVNIGSAPLHIEQIAPSCGCTHVSITKNLLSPGDSAHLSIAFSSEHFSGRVRKSITIVSDDPDQRNLMVEFTANVTTILQAIPSYFFLKKVAVGSVGSGVIRLQNAGKKRLRIISIFDSSGLLMPSFEKSLLAPGETTLVTFSARPKEETLYKGQIEIETDNPEQPRTWIKYMIEAVLGSSDQDSLEHR